MKFELRPNGGALSQGLHPMGDFFAGTPGGNGPPPGVFDPLSQSTSPRTWARSPPRDGSPGAGGTFYHRTGTGAKRGLLNAGQAGSGTKKGKTPGTAGGSRKRRGGSRGADGSSKGSRVSQAARMRAQLAMQEFELIATGSILGIAPPTQPCNCKKSRCLKLYCECFAAGTYCKDCNCQVCANNAVSEPMRTNAVRSTLERNPHAFKPKVKSAGDTHTKGCHCKKSLCLKKYCECFQADILCGDLCKCKLCENYEGSVRLKEIRASKPRNRSSPTLKRPRSNKASPAAGVAAASCAASLADFAQLLPKKGGTAASPTKGAASPAFIQPGSPASEATSEWSAHSGASAQASEKGTKPFGKQCPDLKKPTIFHVSAAPMVFVVVGGGDQSQKLCGVFFPGVFFPD
jgi:hypothetical protein